MEAFACMDDVSLGLVEDTANSARALAFLRRELEDIGTVVNTAKTVPLPPKGTSRRRRKFSLLESVDVRTVGDGQVTVVVVPIGTDDTCWSENWK